ncbi:MAG: helix-turn-helix domain-containing protein [Firmicutes bacterium]|nr:helix-turn-helix domain-containing protein [Bacillota bacterium]
MSQVRVRNSNDARKPSNLRVLRAARGWTQADLARISGVPKMFLSLAETGRVDLTPSDRKKAAAALGVPEAVAFGSPDQLLAGLSEATAN